MQILQCKTEVKYNKITLRIGNNVVNMRQNWIRQILKKQTY